MFYFFFFQAEDGIRDYKVTGVQTCALPISRVRVLGFGSGLNFGFRILVLVSSYGSWFGFGSGVSVLDSLSRLKLGFPG